MREKKSHGRNLRSVARDRNVKRAEADTAGAVIFGAGNGRDAAVIHPMEEGRLGADGITC